MNIIRRLLEEVREYKRASIATPIFMILEVLMLVAAALGLAAGMAGGRYGAKA